MNMKDCSEQVSRMTEAAQGRPDECPKGREHKNHGGKAVGRIISAIAQVTAYSVTTGIIVLICFIWWFGLLVELIHGSARDLLSPYAQTSFTLFGICLVGAIFESTRTRQQEVIKEMFKISLVYLVSAISLTVLNSFVFLVQFTNPVAMIEVLRILLSGTILVLIALGLFGFVVATLYLLYTLMHHYIRRHKRLE